MRSLGLKKVLILSVVLLVGLSVSISSYVLFLQEKQGLTNDIIKNGQDYVKGQSLAIESLINEKVNGLSGLAKLYKNQDFQGSSDEIIQQAKILAATFNTGSAAISFEDGRSYWNVEAEDYPDHLYTGDVRKLSWYIEGRQAPGVTVSEPYLYGSTYWITIIEKIKNGAFSTDMELGFLNEIVKRANNLPGTTAVILNSDTTILASSSPDLELGKKATSYQWFSTLANKAVDQDSTTETYKLNGEEKIFFSQRIRAGDKNWYFCIGINESVAFAKLDASATSAIVITSLAVIISMLLTFGILNILYRPIIALKQTILDLSSGNGDLTQRIEVRTDDDLGQISQGINQFIENLQGMMLEIKSTTVELQSHTERMREQSKKNDENLNSHLAETEQVVTAIEEMNSTADAMATDASNTAEITQRANEVGSTSRIIAEQSKKTISGLITDVDSAVDNVAQMSEKTENINGILEVINSIAEQTNLLALNAAIEAARAGEQGRGFAVVADEVRSLASRTKDSTEEVESALESLLQGTQDVVKSMDNTKSRCQDTISSSSEVEESLGSMSDFVNDIHDLSSQIATAAEEQSCVTQELTRNMTEINNIVRELEENGKSALQEADDIANLNKQLSAIVGRFKL
ncbi:methyl-accepting chemotaxis protein [Photobacterium alginatilyticum]|uniref:Methyl-accepting chemotaxis protein n=1 Tax=Photobacterium alginatilyticum TaxID=1775171 RepID=A0ABW9YD78_9GAMM|nr:methyl-accepting chemotaxis protein [Photobacterium alginatilyticum]NBI51400.1 methyl-accepting chemotaxis protein [Photobacterium alginatilyticum]